MTSATMSRSELVQALEQVKGSVAQKNFLPILTHVLVSGDSLLGYDSEVGVKVKLTTHAPGTFNVKATTFLELLKALEAEEVVITITPEKIHVVCGGHKSTLSQITEEYPKPQLVIKEENWHEVPAGFKEALQRCMLGVSEDENNRLLSSLYVAGHHLYGADGKQVVRCALDDMDLPPMLLSRRAVGELLRLGNPQRVGLAGSVVVFDYDNLLFLARLREGVDGWPQKTMDDMLSKARAPVGVPTGLINALGRMSLFVADDVKHVTFEFGDLGMMLKAVGPTGQGEEMFEPVPGTWGRVQGMSAARAMPLLQFSDSWCPGQHERDPVYFCGATAGFEALLAQSKA